MNNTICQACGEDNLLEHADPNAKDWCVDCADTVDNYDTALKMAGEALEDIVHLWHWSTNYDYDKSPWVVFLDLIGYYDEEFGGKPLRLLRLDFVSLDKVADCLKLYATRPYDVLDIINKLHEID